MGLDITCYKNLTESDGCGDAGLVDIASGWFQFDIQSEFDLADNLSASRAYKAESFMCFRAGSYYSYGNWIRELAKLAEWKLMQLSLFDDVIVSVSLCPMSVKSGAFSELISFSDCKGVIGPQSSSKLARDFAVYQAAADLHPDENFRRQYRQWREAFEFAAERGAVCFH